MLFLLSSRKSFIESSTFELTADSPEMLYLSIFGPLYMKKYRTLDQETPFVVRSVDQKRETKNDGPLMRANSMCTELLLCMTEDDSESKIW